MVRLCSHAGLEPAMQTSICRLSSIEISCVCFPSAGIKSGHHHASRLPPLTQLQVFSHSWTSVFIPLIPQALRPRAHTMLGHLTYFLFGLSRSRSLTGASAEKHTWFFPTATHASSAKIALFSACEGKGFPENKESWWSEALWLVSGARASFPSLWLSLPTIPGCVWPPQIRISVSVVADPRAGGITEGKIPLSIKYSF